MIKSNVENGYRNLLVRDYERARYFVREVGICDNKLIEILPPSKLTKHLSSVLLGKNQAIELISILQHYVDTGELPEEDDLMEKPTEWHENIEADFEADDIPEQSARIDEEDEAEDLEDYKRFQNSSNAHPRPSAALVGHPDPLTGEIVPDPKWEHGSPIAHYSEKIGNAPVKRVPMYESPEVTSKLLDDQSPGEKAYGTKVALMRRLNDLVGRFTEVDLKDFQLMHDILDRIEDRHKDKRPRSPMDPTYS